MKFKVVSEVQYYTLIPSTFIFNLHALNTASQKVLRENLSLNVDLKIEEFTSTHYPNRFIRLHVPQDICFTLNYDAIVETSSQLVDFNNAQEYTQIAYLESDVIPFLFPSRYCQSDKLQRLAFNQFGNIENPFLQVKSITDWIYNNIEYISGSTNSQTSAFDTITERMGVCRDFAHLGIALCRALSIPARYFTGYAYQLQTSDFHACFEAYIGGKWILFDATKLAPLNGMVKIATGRDAADAAVASIFGNSICNYINVNCEFLDTDFISMNYENDNLKGINCE